MAESARKFAEQLINTVSKEFYPVNKITELIESRDADLQKPPERTYTESELAAERAALLREAAEHFPLWDEEVWRLECSCGWKCPAQCNEREYKAIFKNHILAIPTDQSALDKLLAIERAALLREAAATKCEWCRERNVPVEREEFRSGVLRWHNIEGQWIACYSSAILAIPTDQSALARVEAAAYERAKLVCGDWFLNWCNRVGVKVEESNIRQGIAALQDRGREAERNG